MLPEIQTLKHPDPTICKVLKPIIIDRAEDKGLIKPNTQTDTEEYLKYFDDLDITEIIMKFEHRYLKETNKSIFVSERAFYLLYQTHSLGEFYYILHCVIENKPVPSRPSNARKLKIKFALFQKMTKNLLNKTKQKIRS